MHGHHKKHLNQMPQLWTGILENVIRCFENDEELQVTDILISDFGFRILN